MLKLYDSPFENKYLSLTSRYFTDLQIFKLRLCSPIEDHRTTNGRLYFFILFKEIRYKRFDFQLL